MATNRNIADEALAAYFKAPIRIGFGNREERLCLAGEHRVTCINAVYEYAELLRKSKEYEQELLKKITINNNSLEFSKKQVEKYRCLSGGNPTGIDMPDKFSKELIDAENDVDKYKIIASTLNLELKALKAQIHMFIIAHGAAEQSLAENNKYLETFEN